MRIGKTNWRGIHVETGRFEGDGAEGVCGRRVCAGLGGSVRLLNEGLDVKGGRRLGREVYSMFRFGWQAFGEILGRRNLRVDTAKCGPDGKCRGLGRAGGVWARARAEGGDVISGELGRGLRTGRFLGGDDSGWKRKKGA